MTHLYNTPAFKQRRKNLRQSQTDAETKLWHILRDKRLNNLKFFRQYGIDKYILDFYCPTKRLAIELDGSQHDNNKYDIKRTNYLNKENIFVLRFWDNDVLNNISSVYDEIVAVVDKRIITPPTSPYIKGRK